MKYFLGFLLIFSTELLFVEESWAVITWVQKQEINDGTTGATISTGAFSSAVTAGNLIVCTTNMGGAVTSVADNAGNTYTRAYTNGGRDIWYAYNITGHSALDITASLSPNGTGIFSCHEYSGATTTDPLDGSGNYGSSASAAYITSGNITTSQPGDLLFSYGLAGHCNVGEYNRARSRINNDVVQDRIATTAGNHTVTCMHPFTTVGSIHIIGVAFKSANTNYTPDPIQYIQTVAYDSDGTSATTVVVNTKPTGIGNLLVAFVGWEGANGSTVTVSDGSSNFTAEPVVNACSNDCHLQTFYLLATNSSSTAVTATWNASRPWRSMHVWEFDYNGTISFDVAKTNSSGGSSSFSTGNFTTTGTNEIVIASYRQYSGVWTQNPLINGSAATWYAQRNYNQENSSWASYFTSTFTGAATDTLSGSAAWIANAIAFKNSVPAVPRVRHKINNSE